MDLPDLAAPMAPYRRLERPVPCVICGYPCAVIHERFDVAVHPGTDAGSCARELRDRYRASVLANRWMYGSTPTRRR
jgi:hypothetical protein